MTKTESTREAWRALIARAPGRTSAAGVSTVETIRSMSGLEFLRAIADGRLPHPPMSDTLDFFLVEATRGHAVFMGEARHEFYNPIGSVHGGWACTLLDSCMGCAAQSTLAAGQGYTTVELKVNLVRPLSSETGPVRAEGRVVNAGRTIVTAEGRIVGADGKLYAHGTTTCLVLGL
ncbi:MAG: PaaI family thioesterase [Burkholderiales bacterium]